MNKEEKENKEEPPDLRQLKFFANGHSHKNYAFRIEEAIGPDGLKYVRKIGTDKIYKIINDRSYRCIDCGALAEYLIVSQEIIPADYSKQRQIRCQPIYYCPTCEPRPESITLDAIHESELPTNK